MIWEQEQSRIKQRKKTKIKWKNKKIFKNKLKNTTTNDEIDPEKKLIVWKNKMKNENENKRTEE